MKWCTEILNKWKVRYCLYDWLGPHGHSSLFPSPKGSPESRILLRSSATILRPRTLFLTWFQCGMTRGLPAELVTLSLPLHICPFLSNLLGKDRRASVSTGLMIMAVNIGSLVHGWGPTEGQLGRRRCLESGLLPGEAWLHCIFSCATLSKSHHFSVTGF